MLIEKVQDVFKVDSLCDRDCNETIELLFDY